MLVNRADPDDLIRAMHGFEEDADILVRLSEIDKPIVCSRSFLTLQVADDLLKSGYLEAFIPCMLFKLPLGFTGKGDVPSSEGVDEHGEAFSCLNMPGEVIRMREDNILEETIGEGEIPCESCLKGFRRIDCSRSRRNLFEEI